MKSTSGHGPAAEAPEAGRHRQPEDDDDVGDPLDEDRPHRPRGGAAVVALQQKGAVQVAQLGRDQAVDEPREEQDLGRHPVAGCGPDLAQDVPPPPAPEREGQVVHDQGGEQQGGVRAPDEGDRRAEVDARGPPGRAGTMSDQGEDERADGPHVEEVAGRARPRSRGSPRRRAPEELGGLVRSEWPCAVADRGPVLLVGRARLGRPLIGQGDLGSPGPRTAIRRLLAEPLRDLCPHAHGCRGGRALSTGCRATRCRARALSSAAVSNAGRALKLMATSIEVWSPNTPTAARWCWRRTRPRPGCGGRASPGC